MEDRHDEMFCPSCGERMRRDANFCRHCGERNRKRDRADWGPTEREGNQNRDSDGGRGPTANPGSSREPTPDPGRGGERSTERDRRGHGVDPEPGSARTTGRQPAGASRTPPPGATDTATLSQWRAHLPPQVRASEESRLRAVGVAVGLAAASILVPVVAAIGIGSVGAVAFFALQDSGLFTSVPDIALIAGILLLVVAQFAWFAGFGLWYLRRRGLDRDRIVSYLGVSRPTGKQLALVVGTAIAMVIAANLLSAILLQLVDLLGADVQPAENESTQILENNPSPLLLVGGIAFMILVVGPAEELLFRGVIQGRLRERLTPVAAILVASVVFGSVHLFALGGGSGLPGLVLTIAVLSTVALALGTLYEYTGNLVVVALTHGLYNSILITLLYLATVYDVDTEGAILLPDLVTALAV